MTESPRIEYRSDEDGYRRSWPVSKGVLINFFKSVERKNIYVDEMELKNSNTGKTFKCD